MILSMIHTNFTRLSFPETGDVLKWTKNEKGILVQVLKKRILKDIIGIVKTEGDAVESKKSLQKGFK